MELVALLTQLLQAAAAFIPAEMAAKAQLDAVSSMVLKAQSEGRDLTDDEMSQLHATREALSAQLQA